MIDTRKPDTLTGAEILVQCLVREGVDLMFAYPGAATMLVHHALLAVKDTIRVVLPRQEQGGIFAAEGYARTTGKVGVMMATSGPGATNLITGLADAKMDSTPLVAITGQVTTDVIGTDAFQETPTVEIARGVTKAAYLVTDPADLVRTVREAFHIARTGRPGPVLIDLPKDIQMARWTPELDAPMDLPGYRPLPRAGRRDLARVLEAIDRAERPVIYAGGGVVSSGGAAHLRRLVETARIPVAMTLMGLGSLPGTHELSLGMLGMHGTVTANYAVDEADLLIALGARFDDRVTGKVDAFCKHGTIVHIDIDASEINKNKPAQIPIVSDVAFALERLADAAQPRDWPEWRATIADWKRTESLGYRETDDAILPQHVIELLSELTGGEAIVATGVGQHQMWTAQYWPIEAPRSLVTSGGLGSMGFGLPAAMGAQVGNPGRTVVDVDGDGSFQMNIQELATLRVENIPVKAVVLNNQHLGMVVQWEDRFFEGNRGHTFIGCDDYAGTYPDFAAIAKGYGVEARQVERKADLREALEAMLAHDGPYVLDVAVPHQEHVLPMIPTGRTVRDMIKV